MAEIKTFKNPYKLVTDNGYATPHWNIYHAPSGDEGGAFSLDEWDVEVTFTKKRPVVKPETWMTYEASPFDQECVYVLAVHGGSAWVTDDPKNLASGDTTPWTVDVDSLS